MSQTPTLSVVIPVYNEEDNVALLASEIHAALRDYPDYEVIFVDDCSTDTTIQRLQETGRQLPINLRILKHAYNCGQSTALHTGISAAQAEWIATLDGDGQNDPADIPKLLEARQQLADQASLKLICGHRRKRQDSWLKKISSRIANAVRSYLLDDNTPDTGCGLKLFKRQMFLTLPYFDHMHRFLPALFQRAGGNVISVEVNHRPRLQGVSKYGVHNRLWVGIVDLVGVLWLIRRAKLAQVEEVKNDD